MEKQVKKDKGGNLELDILTSLKEGLSPVAISKKLNISMPNLSYYLGKLKQKGYIQKIGYGTWKEVKTHHLVDLSKEVRGHAFIWRIKTKKLNWIKILNELKIPFKLISNKKVASIFLFDRKIWLGKNIIIYEPESFIGTSSIDTRKYAVNRLIEVLDALERKLGISLKPYEFQVARHHYSLIKNSLAIQCNKAGEKIQVSNQNGLWFLIDNSFNLDEAETVHAKTALIDNLGVQRYFNEHKETKFQVTPKFILNGFNQLNNALAQSQAQNLEFRKQIKSHLKLINEYRKENIAWRKNESFKLTKEIKQQRSIREWL